jgi:hypothetical protein
MGAWGADPFDNDDAADWSYAFDDVDEAAGLQLLADALDLGDADAYLEAPEGARAVAAALIVSWLVHPDAIPDSPYGASAAAWVRTTRPTAGPALTAAALAALHRVRSEHSELAELWAEADGTAWLASLAQIEARLQPAT